MNNRAIETTPVNVIIGILIAVVLSLILISLIPKLFSGEGPKDEESSYFYFTKLADDLTKMGIGDKKNSTFLMNKDLALISFRSSVQTIKNSEVSSCIEYNLQDDIDKPVKCRDKNCLCLCETDFTIGINSQILKINCEAEESRCVELPSEIELQDSCKSPVLYTNSETLYDLELKRESNLFTIKTLSKTL